MITKLYPVSDLAINLAVGDEDRSLNLDRNYMYLPEPLSWFTNTRLKDYL